LSKVPQEADPHVALHVTPPTLESFSTAAVTRIVCPVISDEGGGVVKDTAIGSATIGSVSVLLAEGLLVTDAVMMTFVR
jgi:hypothetical protein